MKKSLIALAFGTLGLGISEYVMMGILPNIAGDLNVTIPQAGGLISAYALGVCVGAPLLVLMARKRGLKNILLMLAAIIMIGNLLTAIAPNYGMMWITRFISGLPHGAFFGVGSIVADRVADKGKSSAAVSIVISGITIANLIGVPLGTLITQTLSWRITFMIVGVWGAVILYYIWRWVPRLDPMPDTGFKGQFKFLRSAAPWLLILSTMLVNAGVFSWYSYITPLLTDVSGFDVSSITALMVFAGAGMCIGNYISGRLSDRFTPGRVAASTQIIVLASMVAIFFFAGDKYTSAIMMFLCAGGLFALSTPLQLLLIQNAKGGEMLGAACAQIAFNMGNAIGAYTGGIPIREGYSYEYTAVPGVAFIVMGFVLMYIFCRRYDSADIGRYTKYALIMIRRKITR